MRGLHGHAGTGCSTHDIIMMFGCHDGMSRLKGEFAACLGTSLMQSATGHYMWLPVNATIAGNYTVATPGVQQESTSKKHKSSIPRRLTGLHV